MTETVIRARQNELLDMMCWLHYGATAGIVERVLADPRNRSLADLGLRLPMGTLVTLPVFADDVRPPATIKLWD